MNEEFEFTVTPCVFNVWIIKMIKPILAKEYFNQQTMNKISVAAANLCV